MKIPASSVGAFLISSAIALGAFGAHGLKGSISPQDMEIFEKAVFYHITQSFGVLLLPVLGRLGLCAETVARRASLLLAVAIIVFSGSLYLLVLLNVRWLGAVTPLGGLTMILTWAGVGIHMLRYAQRAN